MSNKPPKKTAEELIEKIKEKNIRCNIKSEVEIIEYLKIHNNYFRTASYRKNYEKHSSGQNEGKYIDLDFGYLTELATIDMHLRFIVLKMCLDLEHSLKVRLLYDISINDEEDGYDIVKCFLERNQQMLIDIFYKSRSTYVGDLINKYFIFEKDSNDKIIPEKTTINCPIWAFMEIITFGDFTKFYSMYYNTYPNGEDYTALLNSIKSLRNACAHNNCLIHNLRKGITKPTSRISQFISKIPNISKSERKNVLSVRVIYELTALIYLYGMVIFEPVKQYRLKELQELINNRMLKNEEFFSNQDIIKSSYKFLRKTVDFLVENTYNDVDIKKH